MPQNNYLHVWGDVRGQGWNADAQMRGWKTINFIVPYLLDDMFEPYLIIHFAF